MKWNIKHEIYFTQKFLSNIGKDEKIDYTSRHFRPSMIFIFASNQCQTISLTSNATINCNEHLCTFRTCLKWQIE